MNIKSLFIGFGLVLLSSFSCTSHYHILDVRKSRILIDSTYDKNPNGRAEAFLSPYKQHVDSIMTPVVGVLACDMASFRPESPLSNLLADILVWAGNEYGEKPDFGVYNIGGIRSSLPKGNITYGDVLDIAPFENKICFLTLKGSDVIELFQDIASTGGEGVSKGVQIVLADKHHLASCSLNGQPINPDSSYRVSTIDYLAQGNDKMEAFKKGVYVDSPKSADNNARFIIVRFFREKMKKGIVVDSKIEGRIKYK